MPNKNNPTLNLKTDIWSNDEYLQFMYERLILMRELLSDTGSIYVHCDDNRGHYIRCIIDEIFGIENFRNQITWKRTAAHNDPGKYGNIHDLIFYYTKSNNLTWNQQYVQHSNESIESSFSYAEAKDGTYIRIKKGEDPPPEYRRFQTVTLRSPNPRPNLVYDFNGYKPHPNGWSVNRERMEKYEKEKRLFYPSSKDGALRLKMYLDESKGIPIQDIWVDIKKLESSSLEREDYPTQKPEALLERIIKASSNPTDSVSFRAGV